MKVCFRTNVGSADAKKHGLGPDLASLMKGKELECSDELGKQLCSPDAAKVILADPVTESAPAPSEKKVKAVPNVDVKS